MTATTPVEFTRDVANDHQQRCGNRVQLEDANGVPIGPANPGGPFEVTQAVPDNLNANANIQVGDVDVANANPVPVSDAGGSLTVDQAVHDNLNANANIQVGDADVAVGNPVPVTLITAPAWEIAYVDDETLNNSDKTIAVTAGMIWHILAIRVEFASDANAGIRQLVIEIQDAVNDVQWEVRPDLTQAASLTYLYNLGSSMADMDAVRDGNWISTPIPPTLIVPEDGQVRIYDNNAIAVNTDDMIVHMIVGERTA